jgi:AraC-like DNA-binding protein
MDVDAALGKAPPSVAKALQLIHAQFDQPLRVEDMARAGGVSVFHFSRTFRKAVGQAPHKYLTARRIAFAMELIERGDCALHEVARRSGYRTQAHFTGAFRAVVGIAPGKYRTQIRQRRATQPTNNTIGEVHVDDLRSPRRPDLRAIRVMICESEIQSYRARYPGLQRDEILFIMAKHGPERQMVDAAMDKCARIRPPRLVDRPDGGREEIAEREAAELGSRAI